MPIRVLVLSDYELVRHGLTSMLARFPDRVSVAGVAKALSADHVDASPPEVEGDVDIAVWASFGSTRDVDLTALRREKRARRLVVACWDFQPGLVRAMLQAGAAGYLGTHLSGEEFVTALEAVQRGEVVVSQPPREDQPPGGAGDDAASSVLRSWPGRDEGLTQREADIVALIGQGLSNQAVADQLFLSINTVKSYIRSAYAKMAVTSRSQAVLWAVDHGLRQPSTH